MRTAQRTRTALIAVLILIIAVSAAVLISISRRRTKAEPDPHAGQVEVYDGFEWTWITPLEGVDVNTLTGEYFRLAGSTPVYIGSDYRVKTGVDVSEHQYGIDWGRVRASGVDFAIIRAGYRGYTEGGIYEDQYFRANMSGAAANGIETGVYFYSQAITVAEAIEEAQFVLELIKDFRITMPVVFDWEKVEDVGAEARTYELPKDVRTDCAVAFCQTVENAGYDACVYFNRNLGYYGYDLSRLTDYDFWFSLPDFVSDSGSTYPSFYYASDMWQYTFSADVPGIEGGTDMNLLFIPVPKPEATPAN